MEYNDCVIEKGKKKKFTQICKNLHKHDFVGSWVFPRLEQHC
jgi:hypothetical protein